MRSLTKMIMHKPSPRGVIRILLVATDTYNTCSFGCDLRRVAAALNKQAQGVYDFQVTGKWVEKAFGAKVISSLSIKKQGALQRPFSIALAAGESRSEQGAAIETYVPIDDAVNQIGQHIVKERLVNDRLTSAQQGTVVLVFGSETVVADTPDNESPVQNPGSAVVTRDLRRSDPSNSPRNYDTRQRKLRETRGGAHGNR